MNKKSKRSARGNSGFTLIELLVVVLIIGILAAVALPQYFKIVEKGRFAEASNCFDAISGSLERYNLKNGTYNGATNATLDVGCPGLKFFSPPTISGTATGYTLTLQRNGTSNGSYGAYTTTLTKPTGAWTCSSATNDCMDLMP